MVGNKTDEGIAEDSDCSIPDHDWGREDLNQKWQQVISFCSLIEKNPAGLDPILLAALIMQESGGDPNIINEDSGAVGLMQIMSSDGLSGELYDCFSDRPTVAQLIVPTFNIEFGSNMLAGLIKSAGEEIGLCRYYHGPSYNYDSCDYSYKVLRIRDLVIGR